MEKQIKMSLETARKMYDDVNLPNYLTHFVLENFTKEELEGKKGFTWEDSFQPGFNIINKEPYGEQEWIAPRIQKCSNTKVMQHFKNQYRTDKQAESALAFAQLSHIVYKYNQGKEDSGDKWVILSEKTSKIGLFELCVLQQIYGGYNLEFFDKNDAITSLEVNRELWEKYWML